MFTYKIDDSLEMKLIDVKDAEALFNLVNSNRTYLREWLPWIDTTLSVDDTLSFIKLAQNQYANNNGFQATIWYANEIVGVVGYHNIDWNHKTTSIGYWLGEWYQSKGIMTRACKAFVDYAFEEMKLNRVEIRCAVGNTKSQMIPRRLGFREEGRIRCGEWLYDHFVDHVIYGMVKKDRI
jgi:ribosomal-protein-serine acetyltransferase